MKKNPTGIFQAVQSSVPLFFPPIVAPFSLVINMPFSAIAYAMLQAKPVFALVGGDGRADYTSCHLFNCQND
ncbi:MAG TPA: hypothetical protein VFZ42_03225 [Chitinophagaceae bacterium]